MAAKEMEGVRRTTSARFCCFFLFFVSSFLRFSARRFVTSLLRIDSLLFSVQMNKRKGWKKKFRFASSLRQQQNIRLFLFCFFFNPTDFLFFSHPTFHRFQATSFCFFFRFSFDSLLFVSTCSHRWMWDPFGFCFLFFFAVRLRRSLCSHWNTASPNSW